MVEVSLEAIVGTPNCSHLWPADFVNLVAGLEAERRVEKWSAVADWCMEHQEHVLYAGFAWVGKRIADPEFKAVGENNQFAKGRMIWKIVGLPRELNPECQDPEGTTRDTLPGAVLILGKNLTRLREMLG